MSAPTGCRGHGVEVAADQITGRANAIIAEGGASTPASTDAGYARRFHQPLDTLASDLHAFIGEFSVDAWRSIGLLRGPVDGPDALDQHRVGVGSGARPATLPGLVTGTGDAECVAHGMDGEHGLVRRHEPEDRDDIASL